MRNTLSIGMSRTERIVIDEVRTIDFLGKDARIYSTPSMVSDIEYACFRLIQEYLAEDESSVGIRVEVEHLGATPMGHWAEITVTVRETDGRRITFEAVVQDALEQVGRGTHTRFVVDVERHHKRINKKLAKLAIAKQG